MSLQPLQSILPKSWERPPGLSHGIVAPHGCRVLCVGGQLAGHTGYGPPPAGMSMAHQFAACLRNVIAVVEEAGGKPTDIAALRVFVTDIAAFKTEQERIAPVWRELLGRHYPAMTMVEVRALYETTALVEIEATVMLARDDCP